MGAAAGSPDAAGRGHGVPLAGRIDGGGQHDEPSEAHGDERPAQDVGGARKRQRDQGDPEVGRDGPGAAEPVDQPRGRRASRAHATEHDREEMGQRAHEDLDDEPGEEPRQHPRDPIGQFGRIRRGERGDRLHAESDQKPDDGGGQHERGGPFEHAPPLGLEGRDEADHRADQVEDEPGRRNRSGSRQHAHGRQREAGDAQRQGSSRGAHRAVGHAGPEHGRPQQEQGAEHGQAHPSEEVEAQMGRVDVLVPGAARADAHDHPGGHPREQGVGGGPVEAHGRGEPSAEAALGHAGQGDQVDDDRRREHGSGHEGHCREAVADAGEDAEYAEVETDQAQDGEHWAGARGVEHGSGEVHSPGDDGVGDRSEQQDVHDSPPLDDPCRVERQQDYGCRQVDQDDGIGHAVPVGPGPSSPGGHRRPRLPRGPGRDAHSGVLSTVLRTMGSEAARRLPATPGTSVPDHRAQVLCGVPPGRDAARTFL